jgi:imidazole glycerol-phosphate synthase subunit HisH
MIGIIDYGLGNINAFSNILKTLDVNFIIPKNISEIQACSKFILPGVGAFDEAVSKIKKLEYYDELEKNILIKKKKILGICVGMQVFLEESEEGSLKGLGWVNGIVKKFSSSNNRIPHMGWNKIIVNNNNIIIKDIIDAEFYFLHSYYCELNEDKKVCARTDYIQKFCSIFVKDNIYGVQFHPEKSHDNGLKLINNFVLMA